MPDKNLEKIAELFQLLSNLNRLNILLAIKERQAMSVSELELQLGLSQSAISHQLSSMRQARILKSETSGKQRIYSFQDAHIEELLDIVLQHMNEK